MGSRSADSLGAVVVGTGAVGGLCHVNGLRRAGFDVKAVVGRDADRTRRRAAMLDVPLGTTSFAEALSLPGVEAVSIATPPATHLALALQAIDAGKHVIVEKPFAASAEEALRMHRAAAAAGVAGLVNCDLRWFPNQVLLEKIVREGAVGEPRFATMLLLLPTFADPSKTIPDWWSAEDQSGGWLGSYAPHVIDHIRAMLGEFEAVSAETTLTSEHDWSVEDSFTVLFRLRNGLHGVLQSSWGVYGPLLSVYRVSGSKGTVWVDGFSVSDAASVWIADRAGAREVPVPREFVLPSPQPTAGEAALVDDLETSYAKGHAGGATGPPFTRLAEVLRDTILGLPVPPLPRPPTFADGVAHMLVLDAIRQSVIERRWVEVAHVDDALAAPVG
jgi:predicted dehydrogenase